MFIYNNKGLSMSKLFKLASLIILFALTMPLYSKEDISPQVRAKLMENLTLSASSQGYEFYVAIPPNENSTNSWMPELLAIYIASTKPTNITVEYGSAHSIIKTARINVPFGVIALTNITGELAFKTHEVRIPETVTNQGFRIRSSDNPVSVYVMNSKNTTSDGYMAIPTSSWGTDYIHCAYYDKQEGTDAQMGIQFFGSGFLIVGGHNNTTVNIDLRGVGGEFSTTTSGRRIGDKWTITINAGQTYIVQGKADTRGMFDLTGSRIKSDKPIGLISYHQRTDLPALIGSSRDHMSEMLPPVQAWGKRYASIEYKRNNKGDKFRVVASEPNTRYSVVWYDMVNDKELGRRSGILRRDGDFMEVSEILQNPGPNLQSVRGVSVFEADKPILVMQYSYSSAWDGHNNFDPFMIVVSAVEQFTRQTVFQTPDREFNDNNFNLIAVGDTSDQERNIKLLQSIKLDGQPFWMMDPSFTANKIPGTNLFWGRTKVAVGPHYIVGDTPFGGYIYGFTSVDSYGWPAAMAINKLSELDTLPPVLEINGKCGEYEVRFTEFRNGDADDDPRQVDQGVSERPTLLDISYNFIEPIFADGFQSYPPNHDKTFKLIVDDLRKDAWAVFAITDLAGNVAVDSIFYSADNISMDPDLLNFGNVKVNDTKELEALIKNNGNSNVNIVSIALKTGTVYKILNPEPVTIPVNDEHALTVQYTPTKEGLQPTNIDVDSIIVITDCLRFAFPLNGRGVIAKIDVADWDAGTVVVGEKKLRTEGIRIANIGTEDLFITEMQWTETSPAFYIENQNVTFPITLRAGGQPLLLTLVVFEPPVEDEFSARLTFISNAEQGKDYSQLTGRSIKPGPYITDFDWLERRVYEIGNDDVHYEGFVTVSNKGTAPLRLTSVELENGTQLSNDGSYKIVSTTPSLQNPNGFIDIFPETETDPQRAKEVRINLRFKPTSEDNEKQTRVIPVFAAKDNINKGDVYGVIEGIGILPKIEVVGYEFPNITEVGSTHVGNGTVTISSTSSTADLHIDRINVTGHTGDFRFITPLPNNITLARGEKIELEVEFTPTRVGKREIQLEIVNDGFRAPNPVQSTFTTVSGVGFFNSFEVTDHNFGRHTRCDVPTSFFFIRNTGISDALIIENIEVEDDYKDIFTIVNFVADEAVQPQDEKAVEVRFTPANRPGEIRNASAQVAIVTNLGTQYATIQGNSVTTRMSLTQPNIDKMVAGMTTTNQYKKFPVMLSLSRNADNTGDYNDAKITSFEVEIKYNPLWLKYNGNVTAGEILNGWTLTGVETIHSETSATLTIYGTGGAMIAADGELFNPNFLIMLSEEKNMTPTFGKISFGERDICVNSINTPGSISVEHCVQDLRIVEINRNVFNLAPIHPNPVSAESVNIQFSVGLDNAFTRIEVINSNGEVVRTLQDGMLSAGNYQARLLTGELGSGVYFINMVSGPFSTKEKIVIVK